MMGATLSRLVAVLVLASLATMVSHTSSAGIAATNPAAAGAPSEMPNDQNVINKVVAALVAENKANQSHIQVFMKDGDIVLRGNVVSDRQRRHAIQAAQKAAPGHTVVADELQLQ